MHEYDTALKRVLRPPGSGVIAALTGAVIEHWHNVELPEVASRRADLLGSTASGTLIHIELQSTNDADMVLRMVEYAIAIRRRFDRFPEQIVLYVGKAPLRMENQIESRHLSYRCRFADFRELDGQLLLASDRLADNIVAILARFDDQRKAVRHILKKVAAAPPEQQDTAFKELMILAGLRDLGEYVKGETERMPILDDIMDHAVIGRERRRGRLEGEREIVLRMIEKRFGTLPDWAHGRLESASLEQIEAIALRLVDPKGDPQGVAPTLEDLLQ